MSDLLVFLVALWLIPFTALGLSIDGLEDSHATFRIGTISGDKTDSKITSKLKGSTYNFEYSRNFSFDMAFVTGFRVAVDPATKRDVLHTSYAGFRLFPLGIGLPSLVSTGDAMISYNSRFKPYVDASLGLGRLVIDYGSAGSAEVSAADTLSICFGGGVMTHFFRRWAIDVQVIYEIIQARGGNENTLAASGTGIWIQLGNSYHF
ncbi:MAG: hypothetical protein WCI18_00235 [Pseudomonadota bacterium]